ncbi:MAG: quinone-dependent dihydroorotate dehydrogenase [Dactylosporangium sp.]|nr:quinone-dependent dihydroorotate dehydrogenase [Dactylosporangium sp.]NNJ59990.1 quinone-dependent dihydroorotate dehydrogenase [Dactylosporangium sp.]
MINEVLLGGYQHLVRPALFRYGGGDPERVHEVTLRWLGRFSRPLGVVRPYGPAQAARTVFGVRFPNPVGLAAGMDKDGTALPAFGALGFGSVEVGTVTWHPQPGNDRPRLFRLPSSEAIVNRMGFNNAGAAALAARLEALGPLAVPLGISLGKSKITPVADAVADYVASLRALYRYGDYFAVNVSSPNTPGLRALQDRDRLADLLAALRAETLSLAGPAVPSPLLVKVAPDLTDAALGEVLDVCAEHGVAGLIATNTTLSRQGLTPADRAAIGDGAGGLSGRPLAARAVEVVRFAAERCDLPVIGVGGILCPEDAVRLMDAGASLVQLYTGLIYRGPGLVRACARALGDR